MDIKQTLQEIRETYERKSWFTNRSVEELSRRDGYYPAPNPYDMPEQQSDWRDHPDD